MLLRRLRQLLALTGFSNRDWLRLAVIWTTWGLLTWTVG
jgi:hypothetical protein